MKIYIAKPGLERRGTGTAQLKPWAEWVVPDPLWHCNVFVLSHIVIIKYRTSCKIFWTCTVCTKTVRTDCGDAGDQCGKPVLIPSKGGLSPHEPGPGAPLKRDLFTLHHDLQKKEPKLQKATMMSMKVHVSSLHAPIYRNFYLCIGKKKLKHSRCRATRESLCANGSVLCDADETIGRTKLPSSIWEEEKIQGLSLWNINHARRVPTFKSMFQWKKNLVRKCKNTCTLILCDYSKIDSVSVKKFSSSIWV